MLLTQFNLLDLNKIAKQIHNCGVYAISRYLAKMGVPLNVTLAIIKVIKPYK